MACGLVIGTFTPIGVALTVPLKSDGDIGRNAPSRQYLGTPDKPAALIFAPRYSLRNSSGSLAIFAAIRRAYDIGDLLSSCARCFPKILDV